MSDSSPASIPTRRRFLGWSGISLVTAAAGFVGWRYAKHWGTLPSAVATAQPLSSVPLAPAAPAADGGILGAEAFIPHLQTEFQAVSTNSIRHSLRLIEVNPAAPIQAPRITYTSFSVLFEAPLFKAEGEVYHLEHAQLGGFDLFLSPVGNPNKKTFLEGIITQRAA